MRSTQHRPPDTVRVGTAAGRLADARVSTPTVVFFAASSASPLTVVAGIVPLGFAATGHIGLPGAFLCVAAVLMIFSVGFVSTAQRLPNAGAFYSYISRGIARPVGVGAAWIALAAYNSLQIGLYGALGPAAAPLLREYLAIDAPWWAISLGAWAIVAALGVTRLRNSARLLLVLLAAEVALVLAYSVANLAHPADGNLDLAALTPTHLWDGSGALLALAVLGFIGFEQGPVFAEQAAPRAVRVATYLSVAGLAGIYTLSSLSTVVTLGADNVVTAAATDPGGLVFGLAAANLGPWAATAGQFLLVTSILAAAIAFHATCTRYAYALGVERVLPARMGQVHPRTMQPTASSLTQSALALMVIVLCAAADLDPLALFYLAGTAGALGVLLLIAGTAIAVVRHLHHNHTGENLWRRRIAPWTSAVLVLAVLGFVLAHYDVLLGTDPDDPLRWTIPAAYLVLAAGGAAYALWLRHTNPRIYSRIGLGAESPITATGDPR